MRAVALGSGGERAFLFRHGETAASAAAGASGASMIWGGMCEHCARAERGAEPLPRPRPPPRPHRAAPARPRPDAAHLPASPPPRVVPPRRGRRRRRRAPRRVGGRAPDAAQGVPAGDLRSRPLGGPGARGVGRRGGGGGGARGRRASLPTPPPCPSPLLAPGRPAGAPARRLDRGRPPQNALGRRGRRARRTAERGRRAAARRAAAAPRAVDRVVGRGAHERDKGCGERGGRDTERRAPAPRP